MRLNLPVTDQKFVLGEDDVIVTRTDCQSRITYANASFLKISGFTLEQVVGQPHNLVRHPDMPPAAFADLWRTVAAGQPWRGIVKNRASSGAHYWVQANVTPIVHQGEITGYISVRTRPTRAEIEAAQALYARMRAGTLTSHELAGGELLRTGWRGGLDTARRLPLGTRCWLALAPAALLGLIAAATAISLGDAIPATARGLITVASLLTALLAICTAAYLNYAVFAPLDQALTQAVRIAGGDIRARFDESGDAQVHRLTRLLNQMNGKLVGVLMDAGVSIQSLRRAADELARGNQDLSSRTEEQAASLEETAASMEQMSASVRHNADVAQETKTLSVAAAEVAQQGGGVVDQVVATMDRIQVASRKIEEINSLIEGIAFQTNILALNAAVEAARAGEHGRGFAVVAAEVRRLAQRSSEAAHEVTGLIEGSVRTVNEGSRQVQAAGTHMTGIVTRSQRVSELIGEISHASREQTEGIGEVNQAVAQLDQVTQQNAALVEQSATAAAQLSDQARQLADAVSVFRIRA
ncbi:MAG: methyl-accepting chemotaxis protein [Burkholderiaceae bacterium]